MGDILIKGMEMPTNCYNCWLGHKCPKYEALLWNEVNKERKADCPLIPVPPHGRLGDLDALIDKVIAKYLEHERKGELVFAAAEVKQDIVDLIGAAPTIIPTEEG